MTKRELDEMTYAQLTQLIVDATEAIKRKSYESGYAQAHYDARTENLASVVFRAN